MRRAYLLIEALIGVIGSRRVTGLHHQQALLQRIFLGLLQRHPATANAANQGRIQHALPVLRALTPLTSSPLPTRARTHRDLSAGVHVAQTAPFRSAAGQTAAASVRTKARKTAAECDGLPSPLAPSRRRALGVHGKRSRRSQVSAKYVTERRRGSTGTHARAPGGAAVPGTPMGTKASLSWTAASAAAAASTKLRIAAGGVKVPYTAPCFAAPNLAPSRPTNLTRQFKC